MTEQIQAPLLPRARPGEVGVPPSSVLALLDAQEAAGLELHSLMVVRHGHVAAAGWWAPYSAQRPHLLYSLSKSFTSTAVGLAMAEGRFGLDDTIVSLLPAHVPDDVHPAVAALTVRHLLSMVTGHREDTLERAWALEPGDLARGFLRVPPDEPAGSRHAYNNPCTYVLGVLVQERTGQDLLDYLRPRLLDPLGVGPAHWDFDGHGHALGFTGLHLTTEAVAAFGQLLLQRGRWGGAQLLPEGWVELATQRHIGTGLAPDDTIDWSQGYGYQFWMSRHGFRGDGAHGQFCLVVPEADLVVVTTACVLDTQALVDTVWDHLLPALDGDAAGGATTTALEDRLASLAIPKVAALPVEGPGAATFRIEGPGDGLAPLAPGTVVTVRPAAGGSEVTLETGARQVAFACGRDAWLESSLGPPGGDPGPWGRSSRGPVPVVAQGGWTAPGTFEADLVLIEQPHRIRLWGKDGHASAGWNAPPLSGAALEAHLP